MKKEQIRKVIEQYISLKDDDSRNQLLLLIQEEEQMVAEVLNEMQEEIQQVEEGIENDQMLKSLQKILGVDKVRLAPVIGISLRSRRRWYWVAASVLFVALISLLMFLPGSKNEEAGLAKKENKLYKDDIAPGGNRATLTLADGSTIILDSAINGAISKQGNTTVIKLSDGQVAYKPSNLNLQPSTINYNTITTPRGGQYQLELADGSKVWLNAASSITFPTSFSGKDRDVKIIGEAYFEVAHNASMPFRVSVGDMKVEVLGTHFNINAYADEGVIKTTLLQGSVKVVEGNASALLKPGQQAQLQTANHQLQTTNNVDVDEVISWKKGLFYFNQDDIQTIMRQIARWYNVEVVFEGKISKETFSGIVDRKSNISQVLTIMEQAGIRFHIEGRKIIIR